MAKVSVVMVAFLEGRKRKVGPHRTDGETYWLHDNPIIRRDKRTFIIDCCGWPTPTTFRVLNQITAVGGRQARGHWDSYSNRGMTLYEDVTLYDKPWNGKARKLRMDEVSISFGLPGASPYYDICKVCKLYTGNDGRRTCGHYPDNGYFDNNRKWVDTEPVCEHRK